MTDELTVCAAAFLRNKGKSVITENEFLMGISMDLRWMPHSDAKKVLAALLAQGIFEKNGEYLKPAFDTSKVDVPVAYRPPPGFAKQLKSNVPADDSIAEDLFPLLMSEAVNAGMEKRDFISESNLIQKKLNVDIAAAGLIVLRDHGVDIGPISDRVYRSVSKK